MPSAQRVTNPCIWAIFAEGDRYVARKFFVAAGFVFDASEELAGDTLEDVRHRLPEGMTNRGRLEGDPASVVENWA